MNVKGLELWATKLYVKKLQISNMFVLEMSLHGHVLSLMLSSCDNIFLRIR